MPPRKHEYHSRRERGLCVECAETVTTARCQRCKARERAREAAASSGKRPVGSGLRTYTTMAGRERAEREALDDYPRRSPPRTLRDYASLVESAPGIAAHAAALREGDRMTETDKAHAHRWLVAADGKTGVCSGCGASREFGASVGTLADGGFAGSAARSRKRGRDASSAIRKSRARGDAP